MKKQDALSIWETLESKKFKGESDWRPPLFDVRLDAMTITAESERDYRVRVTPAPAGFVSAAEWRAVLHGLDTNGIAVEIQNNGIELS